MRRIAALVVACCLPLGACSGRPTESAVEQAGSAAAKATPPTLKEFEESAFCAQFGCRRTWVPGESSDALPAYALTAATDAEVALRTAEDGVINEYTLSFSGREELGDDEKPLISAFVRTIDPAGDTAAIHRFIQLSAQRRAQDVRFARSMSFGQYAVRAATVGERQTINVEREGTRAPASAPR